VFNRFAAIGAAFHYATSWSYGIASPLARQAHDFGIGQPRHGTFSPHLPGGTHHRRARGYGDDWIGGLWPATLPAAISLRSAVEVRSELSGRWGVVGKVVRGLTALSGLLEATAAVGWSVYRPAHPAAPTDKRRRASFLARDAPHRWAAGDKLINNSYNLPHQPQFISSSCRRSRCDRRSADDSNQASLSHRPGPTTGRVITSCDEARTARVDSGSRCVSLPTRVRSSRSCLWRWKFVSLHAA
jgi:hypothetical protein